jgi:hypothetical protein
MKMTDEYRAAIEAVDREVCLLSDLEHEAVADGTTLAPLRASWSELLGHLAVGATLGDSEKAGNADEATR